MSNEIKWDRVQQALGYSDAQMEEVKRSPNLMKIFKAGRRIVKARIIAEVVHSEGCSHGLQPGDRYVFTGHGRLLLEESCDKICIEAMAPLALPRRVVHDRIVEGVDPNGLAFTHIRCYDTGLTGGGMGQVLWKITAEVPE